MRRYSHSVHAAVCMLVHLCVCARACVLQPLPEDNLYAEDPDEEFFRYQNVQDVDGE